MFFNCFFFRIEKASDDGFSVVEFQAVKVKELDPMDVEEGDNQYFVNVDMFSVECDVHQD